MREALGLEVAHRGLGLRIGGAAANRADGGVQHLEARLHALHIDERRQADCAVAVKLQRALARRRQEVGRELADGVRRQQPAGVLQVERVHLGAARQRPQPLGVVLRGVRRADRVGEPDHHLVEAGLAGDVREPDQPLRLVGGIDDLEPAEAVAHHAREHELHELLVRGRPRDEAHARGDHAERRVRHRLADQADPLPGVLAVEAHRHRHVRARREVERAEAHAIHRRRDRQHVGRGQAGRAPEALVAVARGGVDDPDHGPLDPEQRRRRSPPPRRSARRPPPPSPTPRRPPSSSSSSPRSGTPPCPAPPSPRPRRKEPPPEPPPGRRSRASAPRWKGAIGGSRRLAREKERPEPHPATRHPTPETPTKARPLHAARAVESHQSR